MGENVVIQRRITKYGWYSVTISVHKMQIVTMWIKNALPTENTVHNSIYSSITMMITGNQNETVAYNYIQLLDFPFTKSSIPKITSHSFSYWGVYGQMIFKWKKLACFLKQNFSAVK